MSTQLLSDGASPSTAPSHDLLFPEVQRMRAALVVLVGIVAAEHLLRAVGPHGIVSLTPREMSALSSLPLAVSERVVAARILGSTFVQFEGLPANLPKEIVGWLPPELCTSSTEIMLVLAMSNQHRVLASKVISSGSTNAVSCDLGEVLGHVVRHGASAFVIVHNHPSGEVLPSADDIAFTNQIAAGAHVLGLTLVDHLIIAGAKSFSFYESALLPTEHDLAFLFSRRTPDESGPFEASHD